MTNKEKYKRSFDALQPSKAFNVRLEESPMRRKNTALRRALIVVCALLVFSIAGTSAYAANVGNVQRIIQVWLHGDLTEATMIVDEANGSYRLTDKDGKEIGGGGGVVENEDGTLRPANKEELEEHLANEVYTDTIDGKMYLLFKNQKMDLTGKFKDSDYYYVTIQDGDDKIFATITKDGGVASSKTRYLLPNEFRVS